MGFYNVSRKYSCYDNEEESTLIINEQGGQGRNGLHHGGRHLLLRLHVFWVVKRQVHLSKTNGRHLQRLDPMKR